MKKISVNLFNKGLNLDNNPVSVSNDSLIGALNATFITKNGNEVVLQNDMGNASVDKALLPTGYVPLGAKEHGGIIYVASYNPLTDESQIGCFPSPQRNFVNSSNCNLGFDSLCDFIRNGELVRPNYYYINLTYEQKIITIDDSDNIIRTGDKFVITSADCADFVTHRDLLRVRVFIITSDNLSIDITDELTKPRLNFGEGLEFIRDISNNEPIEEDDYTIYTNRTCGQLCLRAELILPYRVELSYSAVYDYNTDVTDLCVHFTAYDKEGNIFLNSLTNPITYYDASIEINGDGSLINSIDGNAEKHYMIVGATDNTIIKVKYYPQFTACYSNTAVISSFKIEDEIQLSLIGSGRITFNTFRYYNDFNNNYLVFNYGLKFYQRDHILSDLYLELINLRDLNSHLWNYDDPTLTKKRIALNTENTYGIYTETIDYLLINSIANINNPINNPIIIDSGLDRISAGLYYLARICAIVDGNTIKGDWHALLTSEATNYIYENGELDMLKLYSDPDSLELLLNYNLIKNNTNIVNDQEELIGTDNYFVITQPLSGEDMRYEVKKHGNVTYIHKADALLIIPKYFPFSLSEILYNPQVDCYIEETDSPINYQDDIITDGTYNPSNKVKHYDNIIIKHNLNIGGNTSQTIAERNGRNKLFYTANPSGSNINLEFQYELYSQLISPFNSLSYLYNNIGPAFISYASRIEELLNSSINIDPNDNTKIYPLKALYCIYSIPGFLAIHRTFIGISNYVNTNYNDPFNFISDHNILGFKNTTGDYQCLDFEISEFLKDALENPNMVILSSCVNGGSNLLPNKYWTTRVEYEMMLLKGIDGNLYLLHEIGNKGDLLNKFNSHFKDIYVYKPELSIQFLYWTGNPNNYFATNDYKIYLDYNISYQKPSGNSSIYIDVHNSQISRILDGESIYLPNIKFNDKVTTEHFLKTISSNSISERVSDFLNPSQIIIGNVAKIENGLSTTYKLNAMNGNIKTPLNENDCYVLDSGNLINCKDYTNSSNQEAYEISQKIKNNELLLNEDHEIVLNSDIIPSGLRYGISYGRYGDPSDVYLTTMFPNNNIKAFNLFI